jgi:hypothetical protein
MKVDSPQLSVYIRAVVFGLLIAEIARVTFTSGLGTAGFLSNIDPRLLLALSALALTSVLAFVILRDAHRKTFEVLRSGRIDLAILALLGVCLTGLITPQLLKFHDGVAALDPLWTLALLAFLLVTLWSPIVRSYIAGTRNSEAQLHFLSDDEIESAEEDKMGVDEHAKEFAQLVLASQSRKAMVFGVDAPWGAGKSSFVKLAQRYWEQQPDQSVIVLRFEALRYASENDLTERLIKDIQREIRSKVFVPEFQPATNQFMRMLRPKSEFGFLGFKFTWESTAETLDESLEVVDRVLKDADKRLIVVIDDLDRLDAKLINNVLFTVRRTFSLSQVAYVLCFDAHVLIGSGDDKERARLFLEKFITVTWNLYVDARQLVAFLKLNWQELASKKDQLIPAQMMIKLGEVRLQLIEFLRSENASEYMSVIGDLRKLKRFFNALALVRLDQVGFVSTDFKARDVIHLMLLRLNFPWVFREIYLEEAEGRNGSFSLRPVRDSQSKVTVLRNGPKFDAYVANVHPGAQFLLKRLFELSSLDLRSTERPDEESQSTRAAFNLEPQRTLERYLELLVRFISPEPIQTFTFYKTMVQKVLDGSGVDEILDRSEFSLANGHEAHDKFWRLLVNNSFDFAERPANACIDSVLYWMPRYTQVDADARGMRSIAVYFLLVLLDRAGWGRRDTASRRNNSNENIREIADRIFGTRSHKGKSLLHSLGAEERGFLGLHDLMLFRLQCSADRGGDVFNVHRALILAQDENAKTDGLTRDLAVFGMRQISQEVFRLFAERYIDAQRNVFEDAYSVSDEQLLGDESSFYVNTAKQQGQDAEFRRVLAGTRTSLWSFVIYQLTNKQVESGVGCGFYDVSGLQNGGQISELMNAYLFDVCFSVEKKSSNALYFFDFCLSRMVNAVFATGEGKGFIFTEQNFAREMNLARLRDFWLKFGNQLRSSEYVKQDRVLVTLSHTAAYGTELPKLFAFLDSLK